jgi:CRISPR/Cas system endoribonuclease Cas6 (RAMP superfamily)
VRVTIGLEASPQRFRFHDSVHAALVAGLAAAGASSADLVGAAARPWSFAVKGFSRRGGESAATTILLSSPDPAIQDAMSALDIRHVRVASTNGDIIDCSGGRLRACHRLPAPGQDAIALALASPVVLVSPKAGREQTRYAESVEEIDLPAALRRSVETRAGRGLDIEIEVDRLALRTSVLKRMVWLRRAPTGRRIGVPAFRFPLAMRGTPADLRFAFLAGLGAKTRQGFGLPIIAV